MVTSNTTVLAYLTPATLTPPLYFTTSPSMLPFISDKHLSLVAPIFLYWTLSLIFHAIDVAQLPYFEKLRIHESPQVLKRNKASVMDVVKAVIIQQIIQTVLGICWLESEETILAREVHVNHLVEMEGLAEAVGKVMSLLLGDKTTDWVAMNMGKDLVQWVYWWGIPLVQLGFAFFVIDTWQYFLHRLFHTVPFLYRHFHSVHHRLYVPYAFGALYNHPVEGLLLDTLGAAIAHSASMMTVRQAVLLFSFSTIKTVDDHCGYRIWWDPCQALFGNNADYHDIHHQVWGIKKNFSQPFFTNWDDILGTRLTRQQASKRFSNLASGSSHHPPSVKSNDSSSSSVSSPPMTTPIIALPPSSVSSDVEIGGLRDRSSRISKEATAPTAPTDIAPTRPVRAKVVMKGSKID